MSPMGTLALVALAAAPGYHEEVMAKVLSSPAAGVQDHRRGAAFDEATLGHLETLVEQFDDAGYRLRVVLLDAGPRFSLGDFATSAWRRGGAGLSDVLIVATSTGVHAQAQFVTYSDARRLARQARAAYRRDAVAGILAFGNRILDEGRRRIRHRTLMVWLALLAALAMLSVFARAWWRRRRGMGPPVASILAVAMLLASPGARAGGWTQPEGAHYLKVWTRTLLGQVGDGQVFFADGELRKIADDYEDHALNVYGELGLTDAWTLILAATPAGRASVGDRRATYIGQLGAGIRRALATGDLKVAAEARYRWAPDVGAKVLASGLAEGRPWLYQATVPSHFLEAELQLGHGLPWGWVAANAGFAQATSEDIGGAIKAGGQLGYSGPAGLVGDLRLGVVEPVDDIDATNASGAGRSRYLGVGLGLSWWFSKRWAVSLGVGSALYAASNAGTLSLELGLEHR